MTQEEAKAEMIRRAERLVLDALDLVPDALMDALIVQKKVPESLRKVFFNELKRRVITKTFECTDVELLEKVAGVITPNKG